MQGKPTRIDWERVEFAGGVIAGHYGITTAATEDEDCTAGDFSASTSGKTWLVEVKAVGRCYHDSGDYFYPLRNPKWRMAHVEGGKKYYMLNALNADGTLGKGVVMADGGIGLAYLFKDGVMYFSPRKLAAAATELGLYLCSQRTEFEAEKKKETWQAKVLVDLSMGKWIPCDVPKRLFDFQTHEDFNTANSVCRGNTKNRASKIYISL